ncbi:DNA-binding XRE family transcriptional regulator [Sinorhizobium fredii]|uniref:helix-turn-helix domain-containing protein n=1 Tax=Rhizobium fredii TaxID=380 RepID=UPI0035111D7F
MTQNQRKMTQNSILRRWLNNVDIFPPRLFLGLMNPVFDLLRAARCLLGYRQVDAEARFGMKDKAIHRLEAGHFKLLPREAFLLKARYQDEGVEFTDAADGHGPGVRWKVAGKVPGKDNPDFFGSRLFRAARGLANISQRKLADLANVDPSFIARLERDRFGSINEVTLRKIEVALRQLNIEITPETGSYGAGVRWISHPNERSQLSRD